MRGWGGGAVFLAMQVPVLEIPAGGRGFPLVAAKTTLFCDIHFLLFFVHFLTIFEGLYFEDSDIAIHQKLLNLIGKPSIQLYRPGFRG